MVCLCRPSSPVPRITLVEPGPVVTEFERKVYDDAEKMDLSGTDEETARIFRQIYLPYSRKVFTSLGQTPEDIAEVSLFRRHLIVMVYKNWVPELNG